MLLCLLDSVYAMIEMVCFCFQLAKMPAMDSAIAVHNAYCSGCVYAEIHSYDSLFAYIVFVKFYIFLKREVQKPFTSTFLQSRNAFFPHTAVSFYIIYI